MKKLFFTALLLISINVFAQSKKRITGFISIPFGSSKTAVIAGVKAKGGTLDPKYTTATVLQFKNVKMGTRKAGLLVVRLVDGKAYEADFYFVPSLEAKTIEYYDSLNEDLSSVYGEGNSYRKFKEPFTDGDGYELTAIKTGNAEYNTFWHNDEDDDDTNSIKTTITEAMLVSVSYQDGKLINKAIEKQEERNKQDL